VIEELGVTEVLGDALKLENEESLPVYGLTEVLEVLEVLWVTEVLGDALKLVREVLEVLWVTEVLGDALKLVREVLEVLWVTEVLGDALKLVREVLEVLWVTEVLGDALKLENEESLPVYGLTEVLGVLGVSTGESGVALPEQFIPKPIGQVQLIKYEVTKTATTSTIIIM
jgi:hypothetical protein